MTYELYLDLVNFTCTLDWADYYGLTDNEAFRIIKKWREI